MLTRFVRKGQNEDIAVKSIGTENVRNEAKWGPGIRNVYILHYVLTGKGYFNGTPVKKDQGFLIKANEIAHYHFDESDPWQYFWIIFSGNQAEQICKKFIPADKNGIFDYGFSEEICDVIPKLLSKRDFMLESEGLAFFYYILSLHERKNSKAEANSENNYVKNAKNYMHFSIHQPISISKIAQNLGISDRYLYNLFIKHEGIAPKKYMNNLRITNAKALLESKKYTMTEISEALGFSDVMTFSSFFSKHVGISPSEYKKKLKDS